MTACANNAPRNAYPTPSPRSGSTVNAASPTAIRFPSQSDAESRGAISSGPATSTRFSRLNPDARDGVTNITAAPPSGCGDLKFQPVSVAVIDVIDSADPSGIRAEYPTRSPPQSPFADGRPVASMIQSAA